MAEIVVLLTNSSVPLTGATVPTIRVRRLDTQALVETDSNMTEVGDGLYSFSLTTVATLEYGFLVDGDPGAAGQVTASERYHYGSVSGITDARLETDIPAVLVDTDVTIPGLLSTMQGNVTDILADTATTIPGTITSLAAQVTVVDGIVDAILVDTDVTIPGLVNAVPAAVWATDIRAADGADYATAAKSLNACRIIQYNALLPAVSGAPGSMVVKEDDGTTTKATFTILDVSGAAVTSAAGIPSNRGAGS